MRERRPSGILFSMTTLVIAATSASFVTGEEVDAAEDWWACANRALNRAALVVGCGERYPELLDHPVRVHVRQPPEYRLPPLLERDALIVAAFADGQLLGWRGLRLPSGDLAARMYEWSMTRERLLGHLVRVAMNGALRIRPCVDGLRPPPVLASASGT